MWQDTWNFFRPHYGRGMDGLTSEEKPGNRKAMITDHILHFPVILLEELMVPDKFPKQCVEPNT